MERSKESGLPGTRHLGMEGSSSLSTLVVRPEGRKQLFGNGHNARETAPATNGRRAPLSSWRTQSDSKVDTKPSASSPGATRIPQPKTTAGTPFSPAGKSTRRSLTMTEAMNLAENEHDDGAASDQVMDASPSPAPRNKFDFMAKTRRESEGPIGGESPARRNWRDTSTRDGKKLTSQDALVDEPGIPGLVPGIEDVPFPSVEGNSRRTKAESPAKSFAWDIDDEFTAGEDLQVSNSPRLKTGRPFANRLPVDDNSSIDVDSKTRLKPGSQNVKLDKIRAWEAQTIEPQLLLDRSTGTPKFRKLEEIRAREKKAADEIPIPDRYAPRPGNTKLDQIQQRELAGIPPRDEAKARLADIKERNSASGSRSPDDAKPRIQLERGHSTPDSRIPLRSRNGGLGDDAGEKVEGTPVTIYKGGERPPARPELNPAASKFRPGYGAGQERGEPQEWIRRLARATSGSPAPAAQARPQTSPAKSERPLNEKSRQTSNGSSHRSPFNNHHNGNRRLNQLRNRNPNAKPMVGFANLRRVRSADSTDSKRSSMHSEADPTDRILGEQRLFAPLDNYSERAASPEPSEDDGEKAQPDDEDVEATPLAKSRPDPLSMPTPIVTGAYVETPATVRTVKFGEDKGTVQMLKERTPSFAKRNQDRDMFSDPEEEPRPVGKPKKQTRRRHSHSVTIKNSATLPTVKGDIRELQRLHNFEDSTMDDLDEIIVGRKPAVNQIESFLKEAQRTAENELEHEDVNGEESEIRAGLDDLDDTTLQLEHAGAEGLDRMNHLLLGIRDSKRGITRLSNQLSKINMDEKQDPVLQPEPLSHKKSAAGHEASHHIYISADPNSKAFYIQLPVPQLFRLNPLRLTWLGLLLFPAVIWFALEAAMCALYCRPETCSTDPCIWSIHDPTFGVATPVKIDQWVTGGRGRPYASQALEQAQDWVADLVDLAVGRDVRAIDTRFMDAGQKKAHRRRLRKKGLLAQGWTAGDEQRQKMESWRQERLARERVMEARAKDPMDWDWDDGSIGDDQRIW